MQKLNTIIAAICLLVFIAGITKMLQLPDSATYFSGFIAFSLLTFRVVSSGLKNDGKGG